MDDDETTHLGGDDSVPAVVPHFVVVDGQVVRVVVGVKSIPEAIKSSQQFVTFQVDFARSPI